MKFFKLFFAAVMLFFANNIWAYNFSAVHNGTTIYYNITNYQSPYTVEVTYRTTSYNNNSYSGSITIPDSVTYNGITYSVTSIGRLAFYGCTGLTSITIPNTVTSIGDTSFAFCIGLTSLTIPNSVTSIGNSVFSDCRGLASVTIPNSVTSIGESAFQCCSGLASVTIPNSVTSIGKRAFGSCTSLSTVNFNADSCVFMGQMRIVVGQIIETVFEYTSVRTLIIGNNVKSIPPYAFAGCALNSITIGDSVTTIGQYAFYRCTYLPSVTIGNSVTNIGDGAFYGCIGLRMVTIPNSVTSIGNSAFRYCTDLTSVTIPNSVTAIGAYAFSGDTLLSSITIPNSVTYIDGSTFEGCTGLTSVTIPNSITTIGNHAFSGCTDLTSVTIPNSVTRIDSYAFHNCTGLTSIIFRRANTSIASNNFDSLPVGLPIHIPCGSRAWYINKLPNFSNFIEELQYSYSVTSQDTVKGTVATITAPTCNTPSWTIRATANTGYTFSHWSDGDTNTQRTLTVNRDTTLIAYFVSVPWYTFSVVSEDTLKGTVQIITQPSQANPQATFVALPNTGYTFSRWSDGNTQNPRTLTVTQDTALVAYFTANTPQWYNFNVVSEDTLKGTVQIITQPSQANPQATFVAVPNTGYTFSRWSDGNTQNPRSITVTQDTILIAFFTSNQGIVEAENASIKLYPNPASDKVTLEGIGNEVNILVINAMGKVVRRYENVGGTVTIRVRDLPKGIYFVRMGNAVRKLVVE